MPPRATTDLGREQGSTLIEGMISLAIMGIVMAALTSFTISSEIISKQQGDAQTAVQVVVEANERVRALRGSDLAKGRDTASTDRQWASPGPPELAAYLTTMNKVSDATAPALAANAVSPAELPTTLELVRRNGVTYTRHYYLGTCWQRTAGELCGKTQGVGYLAYFRVVVAVTWPSPRCPIGGCFELSTTLVSSSPNEPVFNPNATVPPPTPQEPGAQIGQQDALVDLQLTALDGVPPLSWTVATGLPPGLNMDASGNITGVPTTAGSYTWRATVRDTDNRSNRTSPTTWTIRARPQLTGPANQSTISGKPVSAVAVPMTGGSSPFTWQTAALPPGLSIDGNGVISGTPARPGPSPVNSSVTVTVTDALQKTAQRTFTWTVLPALEITTPVSPVTTLGTPVTMQMVATGGTGPYLNWTATGLPAGLVISSTGRVTGTPPGPSGTTSVQLGVTDSAGATVKSTSFTWTVQ